jgi:hypothetical protein
MASAILCLFLPAVAPGDSCIKTLWVDGNEIGSLTAINMLSKEFDRLTIGADGNYLDPNHGLIGQIDEFAIYHGVLSDPCIAWHASFSQGDLDYVNAVKHDDPLLYFRFEEATSHNGDTVINSGSKVGHNGTYIGDAIIGEPNLKAGYMGKCVEFYGADGSNGTCIDVNDYNDDFFPADGNLTVEFWANVPTGPAEEERWWFQHTDRNNENGYGSCVTFWDPGPEADFWYNFIRGGGSTGFVEVNTCGSWKHIVFTFESATTVQLDYCDVVMADDPCLWLRFGDDTVRDSSGHNYWVEYGSNTTIGTEGGGIGSCIYFPGGATGSYVAAANQDTEPNNDPCFAHKYAFTPGDITFEFWYRGRDIPELPTYARFFNQGLRGDEADPYHSPAYEMTGGDVPGARYSRYPYNRENENWGYANQTPAMRIHLDDAWHHIVFSWQEMMGGNNVMNFRLCIDGVTVKGPVNYPDTTPQQGRVGANRGEMDHIVIGRGGWRDSVGAGNSLVGYMDEFAIYGGILPPNRVIAHYDAGRPKNCAELWDRGLVEPWLKLVDKNKNCSIEFVDYASTVVLEWLRCNDPARPPQECPPDWP